MTISEKQIMLLFDIVFCGGIRMERICPNCGKELPEEAEFCLYCFTDIKNFKKDKEAPAKPVVEKTTVAQPEVKEQKKSEKKSKKKMLCRIACVLAFLVVILLCAVGMKSCGRKDAPVNNEDFVTQTTVVKETVAVAVTDPQGEQVTDAQGEQVTSIVEVTKVETITIAATTQKQGFFDKLFSTTAPSKNDKNTTENNTSAGGETSGNGTTETTEKGFIDGIIDSIFGDDEEESTTQETQPSTTEAHATTAPTTVPGTTKPHTTSPVTTTTPSTTQKMTEATTQKPVTTTQKPVTTTQVQTTESSSYYFEYEATSAKYPDGNITLTKYVGNASVVTVPSYIDGRKVAEIGGKCFANDPKIKEIIIEPGTDYILIFDKYAFYNLTSLTQIISTRRSLSFRNSFAYNCPLLYIGKGGGEKNYIENGMRFNGGLVWVTAHPSMTTLTIPSTCNAIANGHNLAEVSNIKVINIHKDVSKVPHMDLHYNDALKAINVESGNPLYISKDGVLFSKLNTSQDSYSYCVYPKGKTDKVFKMPEDEACLLRVTNSSKVVNSYLEELWIYENNELSAPDSKWFYETSFPNLKRIYIEEGHPQYEAIAKTFKGELIVF